MARISKVDQANIEATAAKFEKENGKRHSKLQVLRDAGKISSKLFARMYAAEAKWLDANKIEFSPYFRAWMTRG